jgi:hypothetical protein
MMTLTTRITPSANGRYYHVGWFNNDVLVTMRSGTETACNKLAAGHAPRADKPAPHKAHGHKFR